MSEIRRILFDLDGTLFDTQRLHSQIDADLMRESGIRVSAEALTERFAGRPTVEMFQEMLGCDMETAMHFVEEKWRILMPYAKKVRPLADLRVLFTELRRNSMSLAIGTASPRQWVEDILKHHHLESFFEKGSVISGDMIEHGKPHPEIWLRASGGVSPEYCLVVEDGLAGVEAALMAGMQAALLLPRRREGIFPLERLEQLLDIVRA